MTTLLRRLDQAAMLIAVFAIAMIMFCVSLDAVLRYAFNAPLRWSFELVRYYLMVVGIYFAVSGTLARGDHVSITLFRDMFPKKLRNWLDILWCMVAAVVFAFLVYGTWHNVTDAWENRDFIPGYFLWPSWLSHLAIPLGCALLVLRLVHHSITLAISGDDPDFEEHGEPHE
ncbi:TRAP transporter small permease [Antarctobacter sp.]|uniref:TRAP transporter small permease n=1 Tax=Antarctobacter sp. TaxID=1872577 RepID=UPI003A94436D